MTTSAGDDGGPSVVDQMLEIWRDVLEQGSIGLDASFFDLGGTSMQAVRVFTRITETFNVQLGLSALLEAPTPNELAAFVQAELENPTTDAIGHPGTSASSPWANLVPVSRGGERRPFFCVHGRGGNVLTFQRLARHLDDRPFYGLQAHGLLPGTHPDPSIEMMAARYCRAIRAVQPNGPYLLGGFSGGGVVAIEMARRFATTGDAVDLVVLLDTFCPGVNERPRSEQLRTLRQNLRSRGLRYSARYAGDMVASRLDAWRGQGGPEPAGGVDLTEPFLAALDRFDLTRYDGSAVLFKAERLGATFPADNGWTPFIGGALEVIEAPGDHNSMFAEANVGTLASQLEAVLRRAELRGSERGE